MKPIKLILATLAVLMTTACSAVTYDDAKAESKKAGSMIEELTWNKNGLQIPESERHKLQSWWWREANAVNQACQRDDYACVKKYYISLQDEMAAYRKKAVKKYGLRPKKEYQAPKKIDF